MPTASKKIPTKKAAEPRRLKYKGNLLILKYDPKVYDDDKVKAEALDLEQRLGVPVAVCPIDAMRIRTDGLRGPE